MTVVVSEQTTMSSTHFNTDGRTFTTALTTDLPNHSDDGVSITLVVILPIVLTILLLTCGCFVYYSLKRWRNAKSISYQQKIEKGAENRGFSGENERISGVSAHEISSTRESGAYKSYDPITVDLKDIEKRHDLSKENLADERQSKERSKSGTYLSFDDLEQVVPNLHMPADDFEGMTKRMSSYCDLIIQEETCNDTEYRHTDRRSFHDQLIGSRPNSRISFGRTITHNSVIKSRESQLPEQTRLEIYNPAFGQMEHSNALDKAAILSTTEKTISES